MDQKAGTAYCLPCTPGKHQHLEGKETCTECQIGRSASIVGNNHTECTVCLQSAECIGVQCFHCFICQERNFKCYVDNLYMSYHITKYLLSVCKQVSSTNLKLCLHFRLYLTKTIDLTGVYTWNIYIGQPSLEQENLSRVPIGLIFPKVPQLSHLYNLIISLLVNIV